MIKRAKVLRNTQIIDRFAPHNFLSVVRRDKTREILDIFIGCMEPDRDYILNLHQDEQVDDSHIVITNTVSFSERETCAHMIPIQIFQLMENVTFIETMASIMNTTSFLDAIWLRNDIYGVDVDQ